MQERKSPVRLVGEENVCELAVAGIQTRCLLDTGSMVTTMALKFFHRIQDSHPLLPLAELLRIEGASGHDIPYHGYIEVEVGVGSASVEAPVLIVDDTRYSDDVPVIIGTNVLRAFDEQNITSGGPALQHAIRLTAPNQYPADVPVHSRAAVKIPANGSIVIESKIGVTSSLQAGVLEPLHSLPGGVVMLQCAVSVSRKRTVPVKLCELVGIQKTRTTPYHPMGNGMCERFNSTLLNMLGTLEDKQKENWKKYVPTLVHAYNCTKHDSTGFSPFYMMFGRHPRLPVDLTMGVEFAKSDETTTSEHIQELKEKLEHAYDIASKESGTAAARQKRHYDKRIRGATVEVGDRVLVKNLGLKGKNKFANKFEADPYVVMQQPDPTIPVFVVQKERGQSKPRVLHRNLLLPINFLPLQPRLRLPTPPQPPSPLGTPQPLPRRLPTPPSSSIGVPIPQLSPRRLSTSPPPPSSVGEPTPQQSPERLTTTPEPLSSPIPSNANTPPMALSPQPQRQRRVLPHRPSRQPERYESVNFKG